MQVRVSSLAQALERSQGMDRVVSLVDFGTELPDYKTFHLVLTMADTEVIIEPRSPKREDVEKAFDFCLPYDKVLVHCFMGISRSAAMGISLWVSAGKSVEEAVKLVYVDSPNLYPNKLILQHADDILGMSGALTQQAKEVLSTLDRGLYLWCEVCEKFFRDDDGAHTCKQWYFHEKE